MSQSHILPNTTFHAEDAVRSFFSKHKWPVGYQEAYIRNLQQCPKRFYLIDDSGSMMTADAVRLVQMEGKMIEETTTRWTELQEMIHFHGGLCTAAKCLTEFRFLNQNTPILIGGPDDDGKNFQKLMDSFEIQPKYMTPLCKHIREVVTQISEMSSDLIANGQKVKLIITTDGEASDGNIAQAMKPLKHLPVWVVVRLFTSSQTINDYWASIDSEIELSLDVVQSHIFEAEEIYPLNPWLNYSLPLHRLRETGITFREADFIDEKRLTADQIRNFCLFMYSQYFCIYCLHFSDMVQIIKTDYLILKWIYVVLSIF